MLLRGQDIVDTEQWRDGRPAKAPLPTSEQLAFISASRRGALQRQRYWIGGSTIVAVVTIVLATFAVLSANEAERGRDPAQLALRQATEATNTMVFGLPQQFRDLNVPVTVTRNILAQAENLTTTLVGLGDVKGGSGDLDGAKLALSESLVIRRRLLSEHPNAAQQLRDVASVLQ